MEFVGVSAINPTTIKVTFNKPVEDGTKVTLKRGLVPYTTTNTFAEDKTSVELKASFKLPAADYTVEITDLDDETVTVEAEEASSLTIKNLTAEKNATAEMQLLLVNQYGEEMKLNRADFTMTAYDVTANLTVNVAGAKFELDLSNPLVKNDDQVVLTVVHNKTGLSVTETLTVVNEAANSDFGFGNIILEDDKTRIYSGDTNIEVEYTLADQYGNDIELPANKVGASIGGITFVSTNNTVINPATFATDADGKLTFTAAAKGDATITALVAATGSVSTMAITVYDAEAISSFTASAPASLVVAGEDLKIPFVAVDQFGAEIKGEDITTGDKAKITFASSNAAVIAGTDLSFNADGELILNPTSDGTATIYVYFDGVLQNSIAFTVEETAVATKITSVKDLPALFEADTAAVADITKDNLVIVDQYNREFELTNEKVNIEAKDGTANIVTIDTAFFTVGVDEDVRFGGTATEGTEVFTISLNGVDGSGIDVSMGTVETDNIVSYTLEEVDTIFGAAGHDKDSAYAVTLKLDGKTSSGKTVALVPGKITNVTSSNSVIGTDSATTKIFATDEGTAKVAVWNGADKLGEIDVTASEEASAAKTIKYTEESVTLAQNIAALDANKAISSLLEVKDQYGVDITSTVVGMWTSSDSTIASVDGSGNSITSATKTGSVTIGYVTSNGLVKTIKVTVQ